MVREILLSSGMRGGREPQVVKMSRSHKPELYKMGRNNPACCRQVVNSLYPGAFPAPADSQPHPAVPLAVPLSGQDLQVFLTDPTETRASEVCRELCPLKGQDQQHHSTPDVCSGLSEISCMTSEESSSLCLISKVGVSPIMMRNRMM